MNEDLGNFESELFKYIYIYLFLACQIFLRQPNDCNTFHRPFTLWRSRMCFCGRLTQGACGQSMETECQWLQLGSDAPGPKKEVCNVVTSQASVTIIPKKNLIADKRKTDLTCTSSKMQFFFDVCENKNKKIKIPTAEKAPSETGGKNLLNHRVKL